MFWKEYLEVDEVFLSRGKEICRYKKQLSKFKDSQILSAAKGTAYHGIAIDSTLDDMARTLGVDAFGLLAKLRRSQKHRWLFLPD
jgi:hypothetical protein